MSQFSGLISFDEPRVTGGKNHRGKSTSPPRRKKVDDDCPDSPERRSLIGTSRTTGLITRDGELAVLRPRFNILDHRNRAPSTHVNISDLPQLSTNGQYQELHADQFDQ